MSVIACRIYKDKIGLAADTQLSRNQDKRPNMKYKKIRKVGDLVVGVVGTCTEADLFCIYLEDNKLPKSKKDIMVYMSGFYKYRNGISSKLDPENKDVFSDCTFLVIQSGRVLVIQDLFVSTVKNFAAIGCAEDLAVGAMEHGASEVDAVRIACKYNSACSVPVQTMEIAYEK